MNFLLGFRQGDQEMSLDDALHRGLLDPNSEWIVPSRASGVGPTIEEVYDSSNKSNNFKLR